MEANLNSPKRLYLFILIVSMAASAGCAKLARLMPDTYSGNGTLQSEVRHPASFHSLELTGAYQVTLTQAGPAEIRIEADQNLLPHIKTSVANGKLTVESDGILLPSKPIMLFISNPQYDAIESDGASNIRATTPIASKALSLGLAGTGSYNLRVQAEHLKTEIDGAGTMKLSGTASDHTADIVGSGDVLADSLTASSTHVEISGSGNARLNVVSHLDASITGSGNIRYRGPVTDVHTSVSGSGSVDRVND